MNSNQLQDAKPPNSTILLYPTKYAHSWAMKGGTDVTIRSIRPEGEPLMVKSREVLSQRSMFLRYFPAARFAQRVAHDRLIRMCFLNYDREIALLADCTVSATDEHDIPAVG